MKRTFLDRLVGLFSPGAELRRVQARGERELLLRAYDAAQTYSTSDWTSANKSGANTEIKAAQSKLRERSRDLSRNNPYAVRALSVIVSNTVGSGIVPNIRGRSDAETKKLNELWKLWAETTSCDADGQHDFYGLQALAMRTIVESGEALAMKKTGKGGLKVQLLEGDHLASSKDEGSVVQGVEIKDGQRVAYHILTAHPGERDASDKTITVKAEDIRHIYLKARPGQVRGVPWNHAVIEKLQDIEDYQRATLIRRKVTACIGGFITSSGRDAVLPPAKLKARRETEFTLEPATFKFLRDGEDVKFVAPPGDDGYNDFIRENLGAVAAAYGISREALTGDYSQVNFSAGRMGQNEFRRNVDFWRWNMLIPQFCDPVFRWFCEAHGIDPLKLTVDWVAPAHVQIDPTKEGEALKREVRNGFKTYGQALRELGQDPDSVLREYAEWNKKLDDLKVAFDSDPRRMSQIGFAQAGTALGKLSPDVESLQDKEEGNKNEEETSEAESSGVD